MVQGKSRQSGKRLGGVVLIMVVTVMFVLIIMLLATLTVVSTAQNRSYAKFEENQAYYSARSALDVYVGNMLSDETYKTVDASGNTITHKDADGNDLSKFSQGLAMELDLYKIKAHAETYEDYLAMDDKSEFSSDHWVNPGNAADCSGVTVFADEPMKSDYGSPTEDYIEYEVTYPQIDSSTEAGGKFSDKDSKATIRIEVLARSLGGHSSSAANGDATDIASIQAESRSKDTMTIKVTSTVVYEGYTGTAVGIYSTVDNPSYFYDALTCFGGASSTNNSSVIGGISAKTDVKFTNQGVVYGGAYSSKSTEINTSQNIYVDAGQSVYLGNVSVSNGLYIFPWGYNGTDFDKIPIAYLDGRDGSGNITQEIKIENGCTLGGSDLTDDSGALEVIVNGNLNKTCDALFTVHGNLIVNGDFTFNGKIKVTGSLIVTGNLTVESGNIEAAIGDAIYVGGNTTFDKTPTDKVTAIENMLYMNGSVITITEEWWPAHEIKTETTTFTRPITFSGLADFNNLKSSIDVSKVTDTTSGKGIPLISASSGTITGGVNRYIDSEMSQYSNYYHADGSIITAEEWAGTPNEKDREAENYTALDFGSIPADAAVITPTVTVSGKQNYVLNSNISEINITGSGTANIYVQVTDLPTIVVDNVKVNLYLPSGSYSLKTGNKIWNYEAKTLLENGSPLYFGDISGAMKSPTIRIYLSAGGTLSLQNGAIITGYIYAPEATVDINDTYSLKSLVYYNDELNDCKWNNQSLKNSACNRISIIGAVVCRDLTGNGNNSMYCYVKDSTDKDAGLPQLEWSASEYRAK
jgi:hypothetical protein